MYKLIAKDLPNKSYGTYEHLTWLVKVLGLKTYKILHVSERG